jgi:hypothetical protein
MRDRRNIVETHERHLCKGKTMKKNKCVPSVDRLEGRIALSSGVSTVGGVPVLTDAAIGKAKSLIASAYNTFAKKGQNYNLLASNLAKASNLIPWQKRDTVPDTGTTLNTLFTQVDPGALRTAIANKVPAPVAVANAETIAQLTAFIVQEQSLGRIVIKK